MNTKVRWNEGMQFVGLSKSGHSTIMDTTAGVGGFDSAPTPMEMVVLGLGGCTGMDVVSLLRKMREDFDNFEIAIDTQRADSHPKKIEKISLNYRVWGEVSEKNFQKAISLSLDKYCPVTATLRPGVKINYSYEINPDNKHE